MKYKIQNNTLVNWVFIIIWAQSLTGQIPNADDFTIYNHISHDIDRSISGIYQDQQGFIWLSGNENIYRFDGIDFISVLNLKDKNFVFPQIQPGRNDILQDNRGRYWFLTPTALVRWNPKQASQNAWTKYGPNSSDTIPLPANKMHRIGIDSKGFIWLVFDSQDLYKIDPETGKAIQRIDFRIKEPGLRRSEIDAMEYNRADNRIYFGADYLRIIAVNPDNGMIEYPHLPLRSILKKAGVYDALSRESITDFEKDSTDWWLSLTNNIILRYSFKMGTYKVFKSLKKDYKMQVSRIKGDSKGMIWCSDVTHGMLMINSKTNRKLPLYTKLNEKTSPLGNIIDIYFDKQQVMWLATGKGLAKYDPKEHQFKEYLPYLEKDNTIPYVFYQDQWENEFIGTNNGLLIKLKGNMHFTNIFINQGQKIAINIINICYWFKDHYLLGTTKGIYVLNLLTREINKLDVRGDRYSLSQYFENPATSIVLDTIDKEPVIWFGSKLRFLYKYIPKTKITQVIFPDENDPAAYHHQVIIKIIRTRSGDIWLSTSGGGLSKMTDKLNVKFKSWRNIRNDPNSIQNNNITDFTVTENGNFWLPTITGIDIYDQKKFLHLNHLPNISRNTSAVVKGNASDMWSVSGNELIRWSDDGRLLKIYPKGKYDFNSIFFKSNGEIILWESKSDQFTDFNSTKMYVFNSEKKVIKNDLPITRIIHFEVGKSDSSQMLFRALSKLKYDQNNISFSFGCLSFRTSQSDQFTWKLEGLDESWNNPVSRNYVSYSSLKPGSYIFRVKSCNADGVWDETGDSFGFTILSPFYQTWWFLLLAAILAVSILWYLLQQRTFRLLALQKAELQQSMAIDEERKRIARDMHDDVGSGLSAIHLYSEYLKNAVSDLNPELSFELDKIVRSSAELNQKVKEIIWSNETSERSTSSLIAFLKKYVQELSEINLIHIDIDTSLLNESIILSQTEHKNIYLCVKEGINNAIKYADASKVVIKLWTGSDRKLYVSVTDNGRGFDVQRELQMGGNGLRNITSRMTEVSGNVKFISDNTGTTILMVI